MVLNFLGGAGIQYSISSVTELPFVLFLQSVQDRGNCFLWFLDFVPLTPSGLCFSWVCCAILLNISFIPSNFSKLWGLVLEMTPGTSILTVHRILAAPDTLVFLSCPHFLLGLASPCISPSFRGWPWLAWHPLVLLTMLLPAFSCKLILRRSQMFWFPHSLVFLDSWGYLIS